jgi:hypothetical protein
MANWKYLVKTLGFVSMIDYLEILGNVIELVHSATFIQIFKTKYKGLYMSTNQSIFTTVNVIQKLRYRKYKQYITI